MEKVEPALTPEEWKAGQVRRERPDRLDQYYRPLQWFAVTEHGIQICYPGNPGVNLNDPEMRHVAAALCLHGQPFGFTRQDVIDLGWAKHFLSTPEMDPKGKIAAFFDGLIARIEALLPPEGT